MQWRAAWHTLAPSLPNLCASLPMVVVLPPPFTPTMSSTAGLAFSCRSLLFPLTCRTATMLSFNRVLHRY